MQEDEKIIEALNSFKKETVGNQNDGYIIREKQYQLSKVELYGGKITVLLPDVFVDIPEDLKRLKYPNELRPQVIKTNLEEGMDFCFNLMDYGEGYRDVKQIADATKNAIRTMNPAFTFYETETEELEQYQLSWFSFKSFGLDGDRYNLMYYIGLNGQFLHGVFNCYLRDRDNWSLVAKDVMRNIVIEKNEG